ncbi:RNA polymerase sigma factor [Alicyclobacillus sp. SO9]|uniref:RNA polymerase sigma factor n=1 Tax=Alicyclobacillus sp. SO9 TaxID=2665646 RepID=UPI0018E7AC62|nr:RNA polymerase sigma factor [Alicyclobacillus sp. SO9]QQE80515.1 RNA polymerase sigma factor [Alicyclobacillus sp. SO9]
MDRNKAIEEWFHQFATDIYRFLIYFTGEVENAEDLLQETFTRAYDKFYQFRHDSSPKTWLLQIARNLAIDDVRKSERNMAMDKEFIVPDLVTHDKGPEEATVVIETTRWVLNALSEMNPDFSKVLLVRGIQDLSSKDSAKILGWSVVKVNVTYHRALKAAQKIFSHSERQDEKAGVNS